MESNTKQLTKLPECWYVEVTDKNVKILSEWRGFYNLDSSNIVGICKFYDGTWLGKGHNPKNLISESGLNGYNFGTKITFEQFEKWVLNKNKKNYELW